MPLRHGYHCVYDIHYHLVMPVKYRKALLVGEVETQLVSISLGIQDRYELEIERLGADCDHVHLLCSAHPKHSPGDIVRLFKSTTARGLFKALPWLKKELWGGEFWSDGYYAATVGRRVDWRTLERYIEQQGKRPEDVQLRLFDL
jgi:putative transposase